MDVRVLVQSCKVQKIDLMLFRCPTHGAKANNVAELPMQNVKSLGKRYTICLANKPEFAKLGLLGITMLSASGDSGCHGRTEESCLFHKQMNPDYPASSPYILSVGVRF